MFAMYFGYVTHVQIGRHNGIGWQSMLAFAPWWKLAFVLEKKKERKENEEEETNRGSFSKLL